jgi:chondroitin AC lyase
MSDDTLSIFSHLVLDGQQWMIYGGVWDWSVIGRECSSPHGSGDAMSPAMLQEVPGSRHQEYVNFANRIINKFNPPLVGTVYYWDSDYMVHRQPGYMVSLHMHSNRTIPARCVNSQGIKSEHFADGVVNLYYTGQEYDNIFPVWDWQRLPGITCEQNIPLLPCNYDFPVNSSNFVGGVTDNEHGVAAMHLLSHSLSSLNSWFFFPDVYVAMGTNVTCTSGNPVFTSLANQILDGNVTVKVSGDSTPLTLNTGNHSFLLRGLTDEDDDDDELLWVHHGNTGYFPLDDDEEKMAAPPVMHVNNGPRTGDWSSIGTSHGTITLNVFDMYIDHQLPSGAPHHFQYAVTPLTGLSQMDTLYQSQANIKIISNTPAAQAIFNIKDKTLSAVVWAQNGAELNAGEGWQIQVTVAVLIIVSEDATTPGRLTISLSSPLYPTAEGVTVRIDRSMRCKQGLSWQKVEVDGLRVVTSVNVYLPDGDQWGSSVTLECMMD